jgi:hypothetical protein
VIRTLAKVLMAAAVLLCLPCQASSLEVWAIGEGVRINPLTGKAFEDNAQMLPGGISGDYRKKNWVWDGTSRTVTLRAAANEVVSFQLILEGSGAKGITVASSDLTGQAGTGVPMRNLSFLRAFYVKVRQEKDAKRAPYPLEEGWYPDPLMPLDHPKYGAPFAIDGRNFGGTPPPPAEVQNQTVWVDLWVPKTTAKGRYGGVITVASKTGKAEVKVDLEVHGFTLPDDCGTVLEFMSYQNFIKIPQAGREALFRVAQQHRVTITTTYPIRGYTPELAADASGTRLVWDGFDKAYGPMIDGSLYKDGPRAGEPLPIFVLPFGPELDRPDAKGADRGFDWPLPSKTKGDDPTKEYEVDFTPEYVAKFKALLRDASEHFAARYPRTTIVLFQDGLDEAGFHKASPEAAMGQLRSLQGYIRIVRELKLKNVQYKIDIGSGFNGCVFDLDGNGKMEGSRDVVSALPGADIWNINGLCLDLEALKPAMDQGASVWFYNGFEPRVGPTVIATEATGPRTWPWVLFLSRMQGACQWSFLHGMSDQPWTAGGASSKNRHAGDAMFMYPGDQLGLTGEAFPSMRLKAYRRGMQDYEYFRALAKKDGNDQRAMTIAKGAVSRPMTGRLDMKGFEDDAANERATVVVAGGDTRSWSHDPAVFERTLAELAAALTR